jgi:hypothetical protein
VRFLSKYFLGPKERLVHGLEIFRSHLDCELVDAIAAVKKEREFYTFQTVCAAMKDVFPDCHEELMSGLVEMLAFDALVGNNDRHPANWGVVTKLTGPISPRFSPVFDTARGLFWNNSEKRLAQMLTDQNMLESYIDKSVPQIGWDGRQAINHLELVRLIYQNYRQYHPSLKKFAGEAFNDKAETMIQGEFRQLMSASRIKLIGTCLKLRQRLFRQAIS